MYRTNWLSGGVSVYIKNDLTYEILDELSYCDTTVGMLCFKTSINMSDFSILAMYHPHRNLIENFSHKMKHIFENQNLKKQESHTDR